MMIEHLYLLLRLIIQGIAVLWLLHFYSFSFSWLFVGYNVVYLEQELLSTYSEYNNKTTQH